VQEAGLTLFPLLLLPRADSIIDQRGINATQFSEKENFKRFRRTMRNSIFKFSLKYY
jgi:hypothetical protein